ncbi:NPC intracellular cholesterol transporter 1-like isoform X3 [Hermetia illucens]|nr:NPC intracellular cholesterol transporter 1-like isoform X3 [Hermetia illucens]
MFGETEKEVETNSDFDPSMDVNPAVYCKFLNSLRKGCYERNILDIWKYDEDWIGRLSLDDVIGYLKNTTHSPISGHEMDYSEMLGGVTKNIFGHITAAKALLMQWPTKVNYSEADSKKTGNLAGTESWVTLDGLAWEDGFLKTMNLLRDQIEDNETKVYFEAAKSFGDISEATMFQDTDKLIIGISVMFIYIQVVLSKFSWVELRISLGSVALLSVGLAFISACGICSILGISYGPVHASLPFLLMGLGVDDLFVMMACWREVKDKNLSIEQRIALMLKHAGASITVTSFTDVIAFLVGAFTILPSLQSFCLYAAVGVFMTYVYALTFLIAFFTLDEYRINARRNGVLPCIVHSEEKTEICCELNLMQKAIDKFYRKFVLTKPGKAIIIMTVIGISGYSLEGLLKLEQKFDKDWFIPKGTYLQDYIHNLKKYFPDSGYDGFVFTGQLNYTESLSKIYSLVEDMEERDHIFYDVKSWIKPFHAFVKKYCRKDFTTEKLSDYEWRFYLSKFLHGPSGGKYQANFRFKSDLKCGEPAPNITMAWIDFQFVQFDRRDIYVPAMHQIEEMIGMKNLTSGDGFSGVWARIFANWITDEVIDVEVIRNILLALLCVMICTFVVIIDIQTCFWIFVCVLLTLVNVCGFMQRWGLTVDLVFCIGLELAAGLCVDYAAHIGHTFLTYSDGDRNKRALDTVNHIAAAVLYGGGSTFLSFSMMAGSEAYTFQTFFKIFFLVIVFGLFHGVVFLPVILSLVGPGPYKSKSMDDVRGDDFGVELQPISANGKETVTRSNITNAQDAIDDCEIVKLST